MADESYSEFEPEEYQHLLNVVRLVVHERRQASIPVILANNLKLVLAALWLASRRTPCIAAVLAVVMGLTACSAPTQPFLDQARIECGYGSQDACRRVSGLQAQVNYEQQQQSEKVAAGLLLGLGAIAAGAAAGYSASQPTYYYQPVYVCRGWRC
jgi:hypothetical protein